MYRPDSRPDASGTRANTATPAAAAAGSTSSSGFSRNGFRMIWTFVTFGREIAASACAQVSTETPYAARTPSATSSSSAS